MSLTMPAIAAAAGVSVQSVYKAFGNKAALLKSVFDVAMAGEDIGDDQLLNCEWRDDAALFERIRNRTRNAEIGERHVVQLLDEWWES